MNSKNSTKDSKRNQLTTYKSSNHGQVSNSRSSAGEHSHPLPNTDYESLYSKTSPGTIFGGASPKMNSHGRMYKTANQHEIDARKRNHESAFTQPSANGNRVTPENMARPGARTPANKGTGGQSSRSLQNQPPRDRITNPQNTYKRRARLIDALTAQKDDHIGSDSESNDCSDKADPLPEPDDSLPIANPSTRYVQNTERRHMIPKNKKIKRTYAMPRISNASRSQPESTTASNDNDGESDKHSDLDAYTTPVTPHDPLDMSDDDTTNTVGIRSVHELRRAGANNRFSDEMDDLLSRIGRPSAAPASMRRNALGELALSLKQDKFERQFRDHAARDNVIKGIGEENDIISGSLLAAALIIFLSFGTAPHLLHQLSHERVGKLICRLLPISDDIMAIAFERQANVSRQGRSMLGEVKKLLQSLPLWHGYRPDIISPRTLSLHLLSTLSRHSDSTDIVKIQRDLQHTLTMVAKELAEDEDNKTDRYLVVSILEALSNISIPEDGEIAKAVVVFLRSALETVDEESPFTAVTLKLAINVTNHESAASEFNHLTILTKLSTSISEAFGQAQRDVEHGNPLDHGYDQLLLLLGILINILEHCSLARESVDSTSLKQLSAIWAKNVSSLHDADSVGKSKLSVAFGYLAIAVGYFYIITSNRLEMKHYDNWPGTLQLISTIHDFIGIYRTTNAKVDELEMLVQDLRLLKSTENFVS